MENASILFEKSFGTIAGDPLPLSFMIKRQPVTDCSLQLIVDVAS